MSSFLQKIRQTIIRHQLLRGGERILLGVSGGPDSMALLHAFWEMRREWKLNLVAAYLDHGLRPEAAAEKTFVNQAAAELGIPFATEKADVRALAKEKRLPLQEAAREARYCFFSKTAAELSAEKIALGHTADDQAESVLMRLLRGSGTRGLAGIPPKREERIIRPLIEVWRHEVESFLREKSILFCEDTSNRDPHYLRNRIRRELLPALETYNPQIKQILLATAERFRLEEEFWQDLVREKFTAIVRQERAEGLSLDISMLAGLPAPLRLRIFRRAVETVLGHLRGYGFSHFQAIEKLWQNPAPSKEILLPRGVNVSKSYEDLNFSWPREDPAPFEYLVSQPGVLKIPEIGKEVHLAVRDKADREIFEGSLFTALLEGDYVQFPLTVRTFRPGDRFQPLGMEGQKKIKDFFIDRKIPLNRRRKIPLLLCRDQVLWVVGLRIDHRFRLKPESRRVLQAELR